MCALRQLAAAQPARFLRMRQARTRRYFSARSSRRTVVTVHGFLGNNFQFSGVTRAIQKQDPSARVHRFSYMSNVPLEEAGENLAHALAELDTPAHFVTASMGALVLRSALANPACPPHCFANARVVSVAAPNRGSAWARWLGQRPVLRRAVLSAANAASWDPFGRLTFSAGRPSTQRIDHGGRAQPRSSVPAGAQLMTSGKDYFETVFPPLPASLDGVFVVRGRLPGGGNPALPRPNDGTIAEEETEPANELESVLRKKVLTVAAPHSLILLNRQVVREVVSFLMDDDKQ